MPDPRHIVLFAKVVELGGVRSAAAALGVSKATVSRSIVELEISLDARLFERSPKRLRLTELGSIFFRHCQRVVEGIAEAEAALSAVKGAVVGRLRVACPVTFGRSLLSPAIVTFMDAYPDIRIDLELTNRPVDPIEEDFDMVVRLGPLDDSSLVARDLGELRQEVCASAAYLRQAPSLKSPHDLRHHKVIGFFTGESKTNWRFSRDDQSVEVDVFPRLKVNDPAIRRDAAVAGLGVTLLPSWLLDEDRLAGRLSHLLPDWRTKPTTNLYALYPTRRSLTPKSRAFLDFLAREIPAKLAGSRLAELPTSP